MGSGSGAATWKIVIGLAVVCGVLVFAGGFMHRRSLEASVLDAQTASATYVKTKLTNDVEGVDLSEPLGDAATTSLAKEVDPPGDDGLRIFAPNGTAVFTEDIEAFPADDEALLTARSGSVSRVIDGSDLRVYAPIEGKGGRVDAIAAVVSNYTQMRKDAGGPLDDYRLPLVGVGVVLLVVGLVLMLKATKGPVPVAAAVVTPPRPSKGKLTGFEPASAPVDPAPATLQLAVTEAAAAPTLGGTVEAPEPEKQRFRLGKKSAADDAAPKEKRSMFGRRSAPTEEPTAATVPSDASASALKREISIREALEDQLEQLRTQVKTQQDERATATRELTAQLEEATRRADDAEARLELGGSSDGAAERVAALEQELARAKSTAADAVARAQHLQRAAEATPPPVPAVDQRVAELTAQLTDAQQRASSAEQRAASVESVRDELEVRVAQLGAKASELEQRAGDLETSLQEANAGGDAVRAEIGALTAALAGADARVQELESTPTSAPAPDHATNEAEIARLRGELANQMERAQAAEDRIGTLEADVLAAARGVSTLPERQPELRREPEAPMNVDTPRIEPQREPVPPAPAGDDRYDGMWSAPYSAPEPERAEPEGSPAEPSTAQAPRSDGSDDPEPEVDEATEPAAPEDSEQEVTAEDDMWSLRARLAEAAARKRHHLE